MTKLFAMRASFFALLISLVGIVGPRQAIADETTLLEQDSRAALKSLYSASPGARALGERAKAILIFPNITKAGFIVGGQGGEGVLLVNGKVTAHYNTRAVSIGMQAGMQTFGYAMFFMSDKVLSDFRSSRNFQVGVGPSVVVLDTGAGKDINTLTTKSDIYATIFDQTGLMAGASLQGSKITKLND